MKKEKLNKTNILWVPGGAKSINEVNKGGYYGA